MSDIVLSAGVRSNLLQLQQTSNLITQTQTRLATGKRVNSALDNAINFFTAQGLDNRANDLSGLLDSMSNAINTIQAANNGITAGCGGGNFCPDNPVTRAQMTTFLWNLYHMEHPGSVLPPCQQQFNDVRCAP